MFVFKTIKIPHLIKKERCTRRGRVYYRKSEKGSFKRIFNFLGIICFLVCALYFLFTYEKESPVEESNFLSNFKVEEGAYAEDVLNEENIKSIEFKTAINNEEAQVIIFQTHFSEEYNEEKLEGVKYTVADAGRKLAEILANDYGLTVVHDMGEYDIENGALDRENSYERSGEGVEKLMEKYPNAEIFIDIHRDAYTESENVNYTVVDGKKCAYLMPVVGVCAINNNGVKEDSGYTNEFLYENLKFAYDFRLACQNLSDSLCKEIYLKPYRYSTYHAPMSILLEVGNEKSTFEEVENSLYYAAEGITKAAGIEN